MATDPAKPARSRRPTKKAATVTAMVHQPAPEPAVEPPPAEDAARQPSGVEMDQIIDLIASGHTEITILQRITEALPDLDARQAFAAAMSHVAKNAEYDPLMVMAWSFEAGRKLFRQASAAGEIGEALKVLKFLNETTVKMAGLAKDPSDVPKNESDATTGN